MRTRALALLLLASGCKDSLAPNPLAGGSPGGTPPPAQAPAPQFRAPDPDAVAHSVKTSPPAQIELPTHASFQQGAIEFLGSDLDPAQPKAGGVVTVTNYYKVNRNPGAEWKLFAHIMAPSNGRMQMMGNHDHDPVEGKYPVSQWQPGQVIADSWQIALPAQSPPQVVIVGGFWHDNDRLPVDPPVAGGPAQAQTDGQGGVLLAAFPVQSAGGAGGPSSRPAPPLPTYNVSKTSTPPTIDGRLNDPAWEKAASTGPFTASMSGAPTHTTTTAKLLYDDQFLYVAFDVQDEDIWGTKTQRDEPIYGEEVVEIFIDANGDGRTYNELEVSPHNVIFDAAFEERRKDLDKAMLWDSGMESAVQIDGTLDNGDDVDRGWTVEMKIPIAKLYDVPHIPPQVGDVWRFDLYRLDWYNHRKVNEGQAYSPPLIGDFHNLPRFAYLKFAG